MYSKEITEHFLHPKNTGELDNADFFAESTDQENGNIFKIWIKTDENKCITSAKFKTRGCVPLIAAGSIMTECITGKSIIDVIQTAKNEIQEKTKTLTPEKKRTVRIAIRTLEKALKAHPKSPVAEVFRPLQ